MKKMKKLFSKLVTLVLLVAMLIPYTNVPKVEAEETCENGAWQYHTNYYFFLQAEHPREWARLLSTDGDNEPTYEDSVSTTYYTSFLYNFPSDGSTLDITSANFVKLRNNTNRMNTTEWSLENFYQEMLKMTDSEDKYEYDNPTSFYANYSFDAEGTGTESDALTSYFIHGPWGFVGLNGEEPTSTIDIFERKSIASIESYETANDIRNADEDDVIDAMVDASVVPSGYGISDVNIGTSTQDLTDEIAINNIKSAIKNFNRDKGQESVTGIWKAKNHKTNEVTDDLVLKLYIHRKYDTEDFFGNNLEGLRYQSSTTSAAGGNYFVNSSLKDESAINELTTDSLLYFPEVDMKDWICDGTQMTKDTIYNKDCNDYNYITQGYDNNTNKPSTKRVSDIEAIKLANEDSSATHADSEYFILAPSLFQISYKVCKASNDHTEDTYVISYDGNDANAQGVPDKSEPIKVGTDYTVSSNKPTLEGNTFKIWSTDKECKNGKTIEPGAKLTGVTTDTTLYACWGATNAEGPKDPLGVSTYAALFTGIIALAGGSYYIIKKKNLFKKI